MATAELGVGARLNGAVAFPADNPWNCAVAAEAVDANSAHLLAGITADLGSRCELGLSNAIPFVVVAGNQPQTQIRFAFPKESDGGPYPIPDTAPIEAGPDRRVLVIERDSNHLYELYGASLRADGVWNAGTGAVFRLDSNASRPDAGAGQMSADPSGMPIFPGLVRYEEAHAGLIPHALRFAAQRTRRAYVAPATAWGMATNTDPALPPMGMRLRLRADFAIPKTFSVEGRTILLALKTYGMFLAETGPRWSLTCAPDERWNAEALARELGIVRPEDFEVLVMSGVVTG